MRIGLAPFSGMTAPAQKKKNCATLKDLAETIRIILHAGIWTRPVRESMIAVWWSGRSIRSTVMAALMEHYLLPRLRLKTEWPAG